jgi:hypothetical protein
MNDTALITRPMHRSMNQLRIARPNAYCWVVCTTHFSVQSTHPLSASRFSRSNGELHVAALGFIGTQAAASAKEAIDLLGLTNVATLGAKVLAHQFDNQYCTARQTNKHWLGFGTYALERTRTTQSRNNASRLIGTRHTHLRPC